MARPQLVLDMGGVLVTNISPLFWRQLAETARIDYHQLTSRYRLEVREALWAGRIAEENFWTWMTQAFPSIPEATARQLLRDNLRPLPALSYVPKWAEHADIHILSNHRNEWILPILKPFRHQLTSLTVSSQVGFSKPQAEIFALACRHLPDNASVLFVDDSLPNLEEAAKLGWQTLLADEEGHWTEQLETWLVQNP